MSHARLNLLVIFMLTMLPSAVVRAQQLKPLKISIAPVGLTVRSGAPIDMAVELRWNEDRLLEGRLEVDLVSDDNVLARYRSEELTLSNGEKAFRFMLPPITKSPDLRQVDLVPRFVTEDEVMELGEVGDYQVRIPDSWRRAFVIAVSEPADLVLPELGVDVFRALRFEQFANNYSLETGLGTTVVRMLPPDFPSAGLGYFPYDMAVIAGEGFSQLRPQQLEAIADWVEAGGSVLVIPNRPLRAHHVEFLNRIAGPSTAPSFFLDKEGRIPALAAGTVEQPKMSFTGLGRAVIIGGPLDPERDDIGNPQWRRIVGFLWKVREAEMPAIEDDGKWSYDSEPSQITYVRTQPFEPLPFGTEGKLDGLLSPTSVQGVPFSVVAATLAIFLLVIGPGDYYLLGYFKARKYTWILLPIVALAFTLLMVLYTQHHMGSTDYRNSLVIVDLGEGGKVLRTSRFERIFTATEKTVATPLKDSLYARFDPPVGAVELRDYPYSGSSSSQFGRLLERQNAPLLENRMPTSFVVHDEMQKWSPKFNRHTSLVPTVEPPEFDWDGVNPSSIEGSRETIRKAFPDAYVVWLDGEYAHRLSEHTPRDDIDPLLRSISGGQFGDRAKLFNVVAQVSPTGAGNFEDLQIFDETDPGQCLLAIVMKQGEDLVVFRKLYRTDALE